MILTASARGWAVAHDSKTSFVVVDTAPVEVVAAGVFAFVADQRGDRTVVRITDSESSLSARTIARRLSSISGRYSYLVARGDTAITSNPVPRGLSTGMHHPWTIRFRSSLALHATESTSHTVDLIASPGKL